MTTRCVFVYSKVIQNYVTDPYLVEHSNEYANCFDNMWDESNIMEDKSNMTYRELLVDMSINSLTSSQHNWALPILTFTEVKLNDGSL